MVGPGFWTIGNTEDSILCVHAFDVKYIAVGVHAGKSYLLQLAGETYLQLWECTLPYSIHCICHMEDHHHGNNESSTSSLPRVRHTIHHQRSRTKGARNCHETRQPVVAEEDPKPSSLPLSMELSPSEEKDAPSFEEQQNKTDEEDKKVMGHLIRMTRNHIFPLLSRTIRNW
jgi:hypothetical protein